MTLKDCIRLPWVWITKELNYVHFASEVLSFFESNGRLYMWKTLVLNYVFEWMLRFNDANVKCKIMHGKRMLCQCTEMIIYYSIATSSAFKPSKFYNILIILKGVIWNWEKSWLFKRQKAKWKITILETSVEWIC